MVCVRAVPHSSRWAQPVAGCPSGLLHTHSPFHFLLLHSNDTLEPQDREITQTSLDWAAGGPKLAESANLRRLRDNTNYRGLILDLWPRIHVHAFISLLVAHTDVLETIMSWDKTWIKRLKPPQPSPGTEGTRVPDSYG